MRTLATLAGVILILATVSGCAGTEAPDPSVSSGAATPDTTPADAPGSPRFTLDGITSCDQVEQAVALYIEGLVPAESNVVDEWGASCLWETPESQTDLSQIRAVEVQLAPVEADAEAPDPSMVAQTEGGSVIENDWVAANDGVAFSLTLGTAVAGATSTTVWVPGVEAVIAGGQWADAPALDGPAAVDVVQSLLS